MTSSLYCTALWMQDATVMCSSWKSDVRLSTLESRKYPKDKSHRFHRTVLNRCLCSLKPDFTFSHSCVPREDGSGQPSRALQSNHGQYFQSQRSRLQSPILCRLIGGLSRIT
ncbi:hypothetical protein Mapa_006065 [Marchantia paleacea]|nr:hypothetical protein Mapa_006065 [Marchantia paleacea]